MKSTKMSNSVLYVPFYLRSFSVSEKIIITLFIFISSVAVSLIPFALVLNSTGTSEPNTTEIFSNEAKLWGVLGESN
ncbi:hypothetical protein NIES267_16120 [Calothrix parasitica NIES-267]|uniref:Uncharacterized protein n=1 Tax=Calothrix parasitica NIES-267 TaxID=1973488 RepID=A0A1Z4LLL2_9CYAN|nr:hypothetical protein NIES267_16120 [Calothrix parasitica NIES-267]